MTKTNDRHVAEALARVSSHVAPVDDTPAARDRHLAALAAAMSAPPAPRRRVGLLLALAAVALLGVGAGLFFATRAPAESPVAVAPPPPATPTPTPAPQPDELDNPTDAPLEFRAAEGVQLVLARGAHVTRTGEASVRVTRGEVAAEVAAGQTFRLETLDSTVSVRGGRARVTPGGGCDGHTRVEALAGEVEVSGRPLPAGEVWPKCEQAVAPHIEKERPRVPAPPPSMTPAQPSALERENALYRQALELHRAGEVKKAVAVLDQVLANRSSPLSEAALAHKLKWLTPLDRAAARAAATEYLQRFPRGFGRADAETLLLERP
ncbi:MAG: FecR domain-containing protein [Myxococcota bacterium]